MRALLISDNNFEDVELLAPFYRLREEGVLVDIAALQSGKIKGKHGYEVEAKFSINDVNPADYDLLFLPGGKAPSNLRKNQQVLKIAEYFVEGDKPVAAICHGPQILAAAGVISGRKLTCYPGVAADVKEAGAVYEDAQVVVDGKLVTSRMPDDLPAFMREMVKLIRR